MSWQPRLVEREKVPVMAVQIGLKQDLDEGRPWGETCPSLSEASDWLALQPRPPRGEYTTYTYVIKFGDGLDYVGQFDLSMDSDSLDLAVHMLRYLKFVAYDKQCFWADADEKEQAKKLIRDYLPRSNDG